MLECSKTAQAGYVSSALAVQEKGERCWNLQGGQRGTSAFLQSTNSEEEIKRLGGPEASDSALTDIVHAWALPECAKAEQAKISLLLLP